MVSKVNGIVIKETDAGETGKRIVVLTKEHGKMLLSARGAKNTKSGIMAAAQLFSYCEFSLYEGRGFYSITQADITESFYGIRNDMERLAYGAYILELTERAAFEELENNDAFYLLLRTLYILSSGKRRPRLAAAVYIIRLLKECGFISVCCSECGERLDRSGYYSALSDGLYCSEHSLGAEYKLTSGAMRAVSHIAESALSGLFSFGVSDEVLEELWKFADVNRKKYFGEKYRTLDYINNMIF